MFSKFPQINIERIYNKDYKDKYLDENFGFENESKNQFQYVKNIIYIFTQLGQFERVYDKDVSNFSLNEFITVFNNLGWYNKRVFTSMKSEISKYIKWIFKDDKNHSIDRILYSDITGESKFKRNFFKDSHDLKKCLTDVYGQDDDLISEQYIFYKLFFWMSWLGFTRDEIILMKKENINVDRYSINIGSYVVENIDPYIINLCEKSFQLKEISVMIKSKYKMKKKQYFINQNDYLLKTTQHANSKSGNRPVSNSYFANMTTKTKAIVEKFDIVHPYYNKQLRHVDIKRSGLFCRLYELEKRKVDLKQNSYEAVRLIARLDRDVPNHSLVIFYSNYVKWRQFFYPEFISAI